MPKSHFEPDEDAADYLSECAEDFRYLLLKADVESVAGTLLVEPWIRDCGDPLMIDDLLQDWSFAAEDLYRESASNFHEWLEKQSEEKAPASSAKVIYLEPHIEKRRS